MKKTGVSLAIGLSCLLLIGAGPWPPDDMQDFVDFALPDAAARATSTESLREDRALVIAFGSDWCEYSRRQLQEIRKLREEFAPEDLAIAYVHVGTPSQPVAVPEGTAISLLVDQDGALAGARGIRGVPLVQVADPNGKIVWEKYFTPRAWLRDRVQVALVALDRELSPGTTAGRAQTRCPVTGAPYDRKIFFDHEAGPPGEVVVAERVYFASVGARQAFESDPRTYLLQMAQGRTAPEKVYFAGSSGAGGKAELCRPCGSIKGSKEFLDFWSKPRASCLACRRMLDSPGCCTTDADLARDNLCPACGFPKGSADCCTLQGKELCPNCGLPRTSIGCCHIL